MHASVREMKAHLSAYLHQVAAGEEFVILSHNKPIARLIPHSATLKQSIKNRQAWADELHALRLSLPQYPALPSAVVMLREEARY